MRKYYFFVLCVLFFTLGNVCHAQTDLSKLADSLIKINQPRKAIELYETMAASTNPEKEPMKYLSAILNCLNLQTTNRFISVEKVVISLDSLKHSMVFPYNIVVSVAEAEQYAVSSRSSYSVAYVTRFDSLPMKEWSSRNYAEKISSIVAEILKDGEKLSKLNGDVYIPQLTYHDVPGLKYSALDVVAARLYTLLSWLFFQDMQEIKEHLIETLNRYGCDETLLLFKLRDMNYGDEEEFEKILKESEGRSMQYAVKRTYAVYLYSKGRFNEVMEIYRSDKRFANDAIMTNLSDIVKTKELFFEKKEYIEPYPSQGWDWYVNGRNIKSIDFKIYSITEPISTHYIWEDEIRDYEKTLKVVKSWKQNIDEKNLHNFQKIGIKVPPLAVGRYAIKADAGVGVEPSWFFFDVGTMTCINVGGMMTIVDKTTGEPIVGAEVTFFSKRLKLPEQKYITDSVGGVDYSDFLTGRDIDFNRYFFVIKKDDGEIKTMENDCIDSYFYTVRTAHRVDSIRNFFFDKPIYKPGDTLRYKLVRFNRSAEDVKIHANKKEWVIIQSGDKLIVDTVTTDGYGAAEGKYFIPKDFSHDYISIGGSHVSVAEYKVPQIEIIVDDELTLLSPDTLLVKGRVLTMNHYDVEGALVVYNMGRRNEKKELLTDINGNFSIKIGFDGESFYEWIDISATAPTGHNALISKSVSFRKKMYISLVQYSEVVEIENKENYPDIMIIDMNRKEAVQPVCLKIYKINEPFNAEHYYFRSQIDDNDQLLFSKQFDSARDVNQAVKEFITNAGSYKIRYSLASDTTNFATTCQTFLSKKSKIAIRSNGLYLFSNEKKYQRGDTLEVLLGGSVEDTNVYVYQIMPDRASLMTICRIDSSQVLLRVPFMSDSKTSIRIAAVAVKDGVRNKTMEDFKYDSSKDKLTIEMKTFRDRVKVGAKEQWRLRVKDWNGNGVKAQLLVQMYNAALDNIHKPYERGFDFRFKYNGNTSKYSALFGEDYTFINRKKRFNNRFIPHQLFSLYTPFSFEYDRDLYVGKIDKLYGYIRGESVSFSGSATTIGGITMHDVDVKNFASQPAQPTPSIRTKLDDSGLFITKKESDENGYAEIDFTAPESITTWNVTVTAHTKDIKAGALKFKLATYKQLMVSINKPRFMREGDEIILSARVDNITDKEMECDAKILINETPLEVQKIRIPAGGNQTVSWRVAPKNVSDFFYCTISADCGEHSDGERIVVPYLSNKMLITETASVIVDKGEKKRLKIAIPKGGRDNYMVKLEVMKNPLWLVLENLPVVNAEYAYSNSSIFACIYANLLARHLKKEMPEDIHKMLTDKKKRIRDGGGVLDMNEDVKQISIENSPWLCYPMTDRENYERLLSFYDTANLDKNIEKNLKTLFGYQNRNGFFSWIMGYDRFDRYTSLFIATGFGRLYTMGILKHETFEYSKEVDRLLRGLDQQFERITTDEKLEFLDIYHLYMRSMYPHMAYENHNAELMKCWAVQPLYLQAIIGMTFHNTGYEEGAKLILASLKDRATIGENGEKYWETAWNDVWYARPFETHTVMIEFFNAMGEDVQDIKKYMIINKKANSWGYSTTTVDACYALLLGMGKELNDNGEVSVKIDGRKLKNDGNYFTEIFSGKQIKPSLNNVTVESGSTTAIASLYYQYFEETDKVKRSANGISVERKLITGDSVKLGDRIKVRMIVTADRDMEYVQLRDNRSMALEPVEQVSCYLFTGEIGCRMIARNCSTDFFISYLPKGTHIIDYDVIVTYKGDVTAGFSEIQSLYAPEIKSVSDGEKLKVKS